MSLREAEEQERRRALDMRRLGEECALSQSRLVAALQAVQVANAEADALRATATTAVHDEQVRAEAYAVFLLSSTHSSLRLLAQAHSGAVQSAVQRIQILGRVSIFV